MTKAEIGTEIAKITGIEKSSVLSEIEQFMTVNIYLGGLGSFIVKPRKPIASTRIPYSSSLLTIFQLLNPPTASKEKVTKVTK